MRRTILSLLMTRPERFDFKYAWILPISSSSRSRYQLPVSVEIVPRLSPRNVAHCSRLSRLSSLMSTLSPNRPRVFHEPDDHSVAVLIA